jgi:hypothetical protein
MNFMRFLEKIRKIYQNFHDFQLHEIYLENISQKHRKNLCGFTIFFKDMAEIQADFGFA